MKNKKGSEYGLDVLSCCPYCTLPYDKKDARVLEEKQRHVSLHVTCKECKHSMLLSVVRGRNGMTCAGIFTDCEYDDAKRFHAADRVSADDVLAVHKLLRID